MPTELGERFAKSAGDALRLLAEAAAAARDGTRQQDVVRVSTTASIASLWLIPRLQHFRARHPKFQVWISETKALVEPGSASGVDLAVRAGSGGWPGVRAEPLMDDALVVVCSAALAKKLRVPADLAAVPLLHDEDPNIRWTRWTEAAGLQRPGWATRGTRLAGVALLLQAASAGEGAALVPERLAASHVRDRKLVLPFDLRVRLGPAYWLVRPSRGSPTSAARAFLLWLHAQARVKAHAISVSKR